MTDTPSFPVATPYFAVGRQKLIVMSMATLSTYQLYWFYKNFQRVGSLTGDSGSAMGRAFFAPFTAHRLFARVRTDALSRGIPVRWSTGGLAVIYFGLTVSCFLSYPWWTLALASVFAVLPVHATTQQINAMTEPRAPRNDGYTPGNLTLIVLGLALTVVAIIATREADIFLQQLLDQL